MEKLNDTNPEGIDFYETFARVTKLVIVLFALEVTSKRQWEVLQLDMQLTGNGFKALVGNGLNNPKHAIPCLFFFSKGPY